VIDQEAKSLLLHLTGKGILSEASEVYTSHPVAQPYNPPHTQSAGPRAVTAYADLLARSK
jgi:hypothetical protein